MQYQLLFGRFLEPDRCGVKSIQDRCTEEAMFSLENDTSRPFPVCQRCVGSVLRSFTHTQEVVIVRRLRR